MSSSVGIILPNIWKVITNHVPNHQPVDMGELNHQDGDSCNVQRVNQDLSQGQVNSEVHRQDPSRMRPNHDPLALGHCNTGNFGQWRKNERIACLDET
jgi:hypothetical protein